jgi:uncharacterized spore protein YtfJ
MSDETASRTGAPDRPTQASDALLSSLADRIPARLGASTVYGAPVERDGVTVVPVAVARFGIGAGRGSDPSKGQEGEGGGWGGVITPAGYIELKDGRSRFVPVVHPARMLALICGSVLAGLALMRPQAGRQLASMLPWR